MTTTRTTYRGRTIEIIAPANRYGAPTFTVNDSSPRPGERMLGEYGQSADDCLAMVKKIIDHYDDKGVQGTMAYAFWYAPGTWEQCPNGAGMAYYDHIKPTGAPCNEATCQAWAARKARRALGNPTPSGLSRQLAAAGFERTADDGGRTAGFRVMKNEGGPSTGVRVVWYAEGAGLPLDREPGRLAEVAEFIRAKGKYAVRYDGGATVYVTAKPKTT